MNHNLQAIAKMYEGNSNFGIASFSIDPEHDTPDVMKKYAEDYGVTNPNWHFMTGDRSDIFVLGLMVMEIQSLIIEDQFLWMLLLQKEKKLRK